MQQVLIPPDVAVQRRPPGRWAVLAGLIAGLAGLGITDLCAQLVATLGSPVPAVGEFVINHLPAFLVNFGKDTLGTADKPILQLIIIAGVLAFCGLAGWLEFRRRRAGVFVFAVVAVIGWLAVSTRAGMDLKAYLPSLIGLLFGYMFLNTLIDRLRRWYSPRAQPGARPGADGVRAAPGRREFLGASVLFGALAVAAGLGGRLLAAGASKVTSAATAPLPPSTTTLPPVPAGADLQIPGLTPYVTANDGFYRIDTALIVPRLDAEKWDLTITGMVEQEVTINFAELSAKPLVEHLATLACVSNEVGGDLIGNALWLGFPIRELLAQARPKAGADMVLSTSDDGWTAGTPLSALLDPDREALLAIGMNGEPLPYEHGYPVRMVVPGLYGYVSATKWVRSLEVTTFEADQGYWTPLGWSAKGPIKISSRIDVPAKSRAGAGPVVVAGVAWAQHTGLSKVEVQIDQGEWATAELADTVGPDTWRQWRYVWNAAPGSYSVACRATDTDGLVQEAQEAPPAPNGATGYHRIPVKVV